jgi:hypothetical protein
MFYIREKKEHDSYHQDLILHNIIYFIFLDCIWLVFQHKKDKHRKDKTFHYIICFTLLGCVWLMFQYRMGKCIRDIINTSSYNMFYTLKLCLVSVLIYKEYMHKRQKYICWRNEINIFQKKNWSRYRYF